MPAPQRRPHRPHHSSHALNACAAGKPCGDLIKGSNSSPFQVAYALRRGGRRFVHDIHRSLSLCGTGTGTLRTYEDEDGAHASIAAKHNCHSAWACPVCSPKLAAARDKAIAPQVRKLIAEGYTAHLVTLTVRHFRGDELPFILDGLGAAWTKLASGKAWKEWRSIGNLNTEFLRGVDMMWSVRHGWHPHLHIALYLPPNHPGDVEWFVQRWMKSLRSLGFEAERAAQDISMFTALSTEEAIRTAEKITAYALATAKMPTAEALGMAVKRARHDGSFSPFEILAKAESGDRYFLHLWRQYVAATKGRRQVTTSRGLKLKPDAELALDADNVAVLGDKARQEVEGSPLFGELIEAATIKDRDERRCAVALVLHQLQAEDWRILPVAELHTPPPDTPPPDQQHLRQFVTESPHQPRRLTREELSRNPPVTRLVAPRRGTRT